MSSRITGPSRAATADIIARFANAGYNDPNIARKLEITWPRYVDCAASSRYRLARPDGPASLGTSERTRTMITQRTREIRCAWIAPSEDPDARMLVPGCWERTQDWYAPCTCKTTAQQLHEADARAAGLADEFRRLRDQHHALLSAVGNHPDSAALIAKAHQVETAWRRQTAGSRQ